MPIPDPKESMKLRTFCAKMMNIGMLPIAIAAAIFAPVVCFHASEKDRTLRGGFLLNMSSILSSSFDCVAIRKPQI